MKNITVAIRYLDNGKLQQGQIKVSKRDIEKGWFSVDILCWTGPQNSSITKRFRVYDTGTEKNGLRIYAPL